MTHGQNSHFPGEKALNSYIFAFLGKQMQPGNIMCFFTLGNTSFRKRMFSFGNARKKTFFLNEVFPYSANKPHPCTRPSPN